MIMKRCLASLVLLGAAAYAADLPLTVSDVVTGPKSHARITNRSNQPVTAWSLAVVTPTASGTHRDVETVDGYLSEATSGLPGSSPRLDRLLPGDARDIELETVPSDATIEVLAVVLDDGTAIGDEPIIAAIFERRVKEREALQAVVDAFNATLPNMPSPSALDELRNRLQALVQRDASVACRAALETVETYRTRAASANPEDVTQALSRYAAFVTSEYELAKKHSQRRVPAHED
jgi:hypothetical protein